MVDSWLKVQAPGEFLASGLQENLLEMQRRPAIVQ
jgi:hypothetical protein